MTNPSANTQILSAVNDMVEAQNPSDMKEILHRWLIVWLTESDEINKKDKDDFTVLYVELRLFFGKLEQINKA